MKAENPYEKLFQLILPEDIALFFDLVDVTGKVVADGGNFICIWTKSQLFPQFTVLPTFPQMVFMKRKVFKIFRYVTGVCNCPSAIADG
jgi:hypothetical protein